MIVIEVIVLAIYVFFQVTCMMVMPDKIMSDKPISFGKNLLRFTIMIICVPLGWVLLLCILTQKLEKLLDEKL